MESCATARELAERRSEARSLRAGGGGAAKKVAAAACEGAQARGAGGGKIVQRGATAAHEGQKTMERERRARAARGADNR